jgi:hypothetical protein
MHDTQTARPDGKKPLMNSVTPGEVWVVAGFVGTPGNNITSVVTSGDGKSAVDQVTTRNAGFQLISATSLESLELLCTAARAEVTKAGFVIKG